jgi:methyl-accepting chemotaxis protein
MARRTAGSVLNSLKSKIWLATSALAFFVSSFGLIAYLLVSSLVSDNFYAIFTIFLFSAFAIMVFGWWLSNEVVSPIEKVSLLAKSLERGFSTSLPKTSGSTETDELLESLHRNNQQIQNLVNLMDKVAGGELDVALTPLQNSDRLSSSFQKLLARVTDSIHAKQELEKLEAAVAQIKEKTAPVRNRNFEVEIKSDFAPVKEIAETFEYLLQIAADLAAQVKTDARLAGNSAAETRKTLQTIIYRTENQVYELKQATLVLKQIPQTVQKISEELGLSAIAASHSIEKARKGTHDAQENLNAVGAVRRQIQESAKRIGRLNERSQEIAQVSKAVEDLARRVNMIALNASIRADELGEAGRGFAVVAEEVGRLAGRAENTSKQMRGLNKTISVEITQVEQSLEAAVGEVVNLSKYSIETGNALGELERYISKYLSLQNKIVGYSRERSEETEKAFKIFVASISDSETIVKNLKETEETIGKAAALMKNLQAAVGDFRFGAGEEKISNATLEAEITLAPEIISSV